MDSKDQYYFQPRSKSNLIASSKRQEASKRSKLTVFSDPDNGIVFLQDGRRF